MSFYGLIALDLAIDRRREDLDWASRSSLAREAGRVGGPARPPRRPSIRAVFAGAVRMFGDAAHWLSDLACVVASRIEGRTA